MKQNHHKEVYDQEDEILLKHALLFLFNSKWIILGITSLLTMISIFYVKSITPMYEAVVSVYPPSSLSVTKINNARFRYKDTIPKLEIDFSKADIYEMVLYKLFSNSFREKVFTSNNYLKKLNLNESDNFSTLDFVKKVRHRSINAATNETSFVLMGEDPLIISNFLNDLIRVALSDTLKDIKLMEQEQIDSRLSFIETELNLEKMNVKKIRLQRIKEIQEELKIAVSLKNKEFNFSQLNQVSNNSLKIHPSSTEAMPIWYLYGEQALLQELDKLTSDKTVKSSLIDALESEKAEFSSVDISDISDIEVAGVNRSEVPNSPISPKKRLFVTVIFFISLIVSIFIAYIVTVVRKK